jgi:hypothetical protein
MRYVASQSVIRDLVTGVVIGRGMTAEFARRLAKGLNVLDELEKGSGGESGGEPGSSGAEEPGSSGAEGPDGSGSEGAEEEADTVRIRVKRRRKRGVK